MKKKIVEIVNSLSIKEFLFVIIIGFLYFVNLAQKNKLKNEINKLKLVNSAFIKVSNINDSLIHQADVIKSESEKEVKAISGQIFKTKTKTVYIHSEKISASKIRDIIAKFTDSTENLKDTIYITDSTNIKFKYKNSWYNIIGSVVKKGVLFDSIIVKDTSFFRIADYPKGFLGLKKETKIEYVSLNPYIITSAQNTIVLNPKTNRWNKFIKPTLFFGLGLLIAK